MSAFLVAPHLIVGADEANGDTLAASHRSANTTTTTTTTTALAAAAAARRRRLLHHSSNYNNRTSATTTTTLTSNTKMPRLCPLLTTTAPEAMANRSSRSRSKSRSERFLEAAIHENESSLSFNLCNQLNDDDNNLNRAAIKRGRRKTLSCLSQSSGGSLSIIVALSTLLLLTSGGGCFYQLASASMCQYHQAYLESQAINNNNNNNNNNLSPRQPQQQQLHQNLIVCPKASQYNNLPVQFQSINSKVLTSPAFERHQRDLLKSLNASFTNYLQLNNHQQQQQQQVVAAASSLSPQAALVVPTAAAAQAQASQVQPLIASDLIDDELLNEIVSPLIIDEAYVRAKEQIVKRRKLEGELIKQGFVTDMRTPSAVARHQRVTTTTTRGNELEKSQEVLDEMSRILLQNLTNTINMRMMAATGALGSENGNGLNGVDMQSSRALLARNQLAQASQLGNGRTSQTELEAGPGAIATSATGSGAGELETAASEQQLLERADTNQLLSRIDLHLSEARHAVSRCEEDQAIVCDPNFPYRHADGRCNNLDKPTWGKSNTCFARLLPPEYSDGQGAPRISVTGHPLPNPRILSAIVHRDFNYPATYTHFVMQYGQFFAHDIAFTPSSRTKSGQMIQCCPIERDSHPQCFPILVPPDDPFYSNWEESCLNFVRTAICPRCRLGPREQMNQITSFVDGSQVYGAAANETAALWTKSGPAGRMHVSFDDSGRELLPHSADPSNDQCSDVEKGQFCYRAGDRRVNQHPALTAVHTIWLRQHNRLVNGLKMVNPHWNGDRLYQEAKRISTAQMQMVTYNEWLSLIIGQEAMKFLKLNVLTSGYTKYDPTVDPSLLNEFSGAAFRFGHSMINNIFAEILPDGRPSGYRLNEFFFHPFGLKAGQHDMVMRGLISQASQNRDPFVSSDIKNHLYRPRDNPYGLDLPAFNIQRGRDHGIPGYTKLVEFCFDDVITNWKQLDQYMPVSQRIRFSKLYRSVHDLDLFSAGLAEYPLPGAALGPTFTCIVGIQMFNLKYGDRFWFEHGGQVGSFSPDQLQEIRKSNLARLVCVNSDNINVIQKNVFRGESPANPSVPCNSLPDTDLRAWKEEPGYRSAFAAAAEKLGTSQSGDHNDDNYLNKPPTAPKEKRHQQNIEQEPLAYPFRSGSRHANNMQPDKNSNYQQQQHGSLGSGYEAIMTQAYPPMKPTTTMMMTTFKHDGGGGSSSSGSNKEQQQVYKKVAMRPGGRGGGANKYRASFKMGQVMMTKSNNHYAPMLQGHSQQQRHQEYSNMRRPSFGMPMVYKM